MWYSSHLLHLKCQVAQCETPTERDASVSLIFTQPPALIHIYSRTCSKNSKAVYILGVDGKRSILIPLFTSRLHSHHDPCTSLPKRWAEERAQWNRSEDCGPWERHPGCWWIYRYDLSNHTLNVCKQYLTGSLSNKLNHHLNPAFYITQVRIRIM